MRAVVVVDQGEGWVRIDRRREERTVSSHEQIDWEWLRGVLWLGGEPGAPPHNAEVDDRWLPDGDGPCYILTPAGWVADHKAAELIVRSVTSPSGA